MIYSKKLTLIVSALLLFSFSGCVKKGQDDPMISLRTRKARVVGKWTLSSGFTHYTNVYNSAGTQFREIHLVYTKNSFSQTDVSSYGTNTSSGSNSYTMEFKKDGGFSSTMIQDGHMTMTEGTWNFTGSVGEHKNKEEIVINIKNNSYTDENSTATFMNSFTGNKYDVTYTLKELRNKKMVMSSSYGTDGTSSKDSEFTFEQ